MTQPTKGSIRTVLLLGGLALAAGIARPAPAGEPPAPAEPAYPLKKVPFLTWVVDYEPFWSPDGRSIALISSRHGGMKLHIVDASGGEHGAKMTQLTFDGFEDDSPAFSPDAKRIAYVSVRDGVSQVRVINADGTGDHAATTGRAESIHPTWTADGGRILINTNAFAAPPAGTPPEGAGRPRTIGDATDDAMELATIRPDGTGLTRLTTGGGYTYASCSPDGRFIVHRRILGKVSQIWVMNADGTADHNVSGTATADGWPAWSPDGKRIVFARQAGSTPDGFQIFVMNRDGSNVRQLTDAAGRFTNPRWSPDGRTILCSRGLGSLSLVTFPAPANP